MIQFTTLKAQDCFSYRTLDFNFATGLHSVSGTNGSSKTSIFLTLCQGLFNRNPKNCKVDDVNNSITARPYEIEVEFTKGSDQYRVVNSRKLGSIKLLKNGSDISLKRIPDTLKLISEVLEADYELFADLTYQSKSSTLNLLDSSTNKGRAEFVNRILKLDELDAHLTRMEGTRKSLEGKNGQLANLREQIRMAEASVAEPAEIGEETPEVDATGVREQLNSTIEEFANTNRDIMQYRNKLEDASKAEASLRKRVELQTKLDAAEVPSTPLDTLELNLRSELQLISSQAVKLTQFRAEYDKLKAAKSKGECYACGHQIDATLFDAEIQRVKSLGNALKEDQDARKVKAVECEAAISLWKIRRTLEADIARLQTPDTQIDVAAIQEHLADSLSEMLRLKEYRIVLEETLSIAAKIREHNAAIRAQQQMNLRIIGNNRQILLTLDLKKKELEEAEGRVELLKTWNGILGARGFRTARIAKFLKSLNLTMNKYAKLMCGGRIICRFYLDEKGEINFEITDEAKSQDIALWSGGETSRIKIVCLFAVLELLEVMGSVSFNVLCLDEIFSTLDSEGKSGLFEILAYLKGKDKALYTIAHEELALDMLYDTHIKAEKLDDGTTRILQ